MANDIDVGGDLIPFENQDLSKPIEIVKASTELVKYWEKDHIHKCMRKIDNPRHQMLMTFLWMTGVRITEALEVTKGNIDFENYVIDILWQKHKKNQTKKGSKWYRRMLPLHPTLRDMLRIYTSPMKEGERIFPITRQRAYQVSMRYFGGSPHMFRHSFAVNWLRCGGEIVTLSRMLGHKDLKTTMIYLQIVPLDQGKELLKIEF